MHGDKGKDKDGSRVHGDHLMCKHQQQQQQQQKERHEVFA